MVEHYGITEDIPVPVFVGNLLLCEVDAGHLDKSATSAFNKTVGPLSFGGGCNDIGIVVVYPAEEVAPHEFLIKVGVESAGKSAYVSAELGEGVDDLV